MDSGCPLVTSGCSGGLRPSLRWLRPRSDVDRRLENGTDEPVVRDVAPLRVIHVHGMTSEQGFKSAAVVARVSVNGPKQLLQ